MTLSMKNIPIPKKEEFKLKLIGQAEKFARNLRWRAIHFLEKLENLANDNNNQVNNQENEFKTYGFKTGNKPPKVKELENFEKEFFEMIKNAEFRNVNSEFMDKLKDDLENHKESGKIAIQADKSRNYYSINKDNYDQLLTNEVTKQYKKTDISNVKNADINSAKIATELKLADRIQKHTESEAYITIKDHKENFMNTKPCRLINPAKSEIQKISKDILDRVNTRIGERTGLNQWKNTQAVISWIQPLFGYTGPQSFLKFDIEQYYPSITEELLIKSLNFAQKYICITGKEMDIILQSRRTFLFKDGTPWTKKKGNFDVGMGSYDSAEISNLCGYFLTSKITTGNNKLFDKALVGLYRDDGLSIVRTKSGRVLEQLKQKLERAFAEENLKITVEKGLTRTDFLDVTFDLESKTYRPYKKPNDVLVYVDPRSNHPKNIIESIPKMIEKRISNLSSNEEIFNQVKGTWEKGLKDSGYKKDQCKLQYEKPNTKKKRIRNKEPALYFNPPYSKSCKTNIGANFLKLIDKHFPKTHKLHKSINRHTVKVSYSTMNNMGTNITKINTKVIKKSKKKKPRKACNCLSKTICPLKGKCNKEENESVVYKGLVKCRDEQNNIIKPLSYIGCTSNEFKKRWYSHNSTFEQPDHKSPTTLSTYIWKLKNRGLTPMVKWSVLYKAHAFSSGSKQCNLCLKEKLTILEADPKTILNKRDELLEKCRHKGYFMLKDCLKSKKNPQDPP